MQIRLILSCFTAIALIGLALAQKEDEDIARDLRVNQYSLGSLRVVSAQSDPNSSTAYAFAQVTRLPVLSRIDPRAASVLSRGGTIQEAAEAAQMSPRVLLQQIMSMTPNPSKPTTFKIACDTRIDRNCSALIAGKEYPFFFNDKRGQPALLIAISDGRKYRAVKYGVYGSAIHR